MNFGEFLRSKREQRGVSLRALGENIGVSATHLHDIELGRRGSIVDLTRLSKIRDVLNLDVEDYCILLNLAGKQRATIAPDLVEYISERDYVSNAIRVARDSGATKEDWEQFTNKLRGIK